jgi:hypothetical protein
VRVRLLRWLALSLLGTAPLLACSASGGSGAAGAGGAGAATGGPSTSGPGSGAGGSGGAGAGGEDGGAIIDFDSGSMDAGECKHLNIGIFGNPGANASSNFQQWLEMSGTSVQRIQTTAGVTITAATVQPFDVIVLDWLTRDYTSAEAAVLSAFVSAGGGVASMSGYNGTSDDWRANSLLAPLGVAYGGPLLNGPVTSFAAHPMTAGLTSVTFAGGYGISDLGGAASTRTPIASLPQAGVNAGYAIQMGAGRAFVWGDEWIEFDSEWSALPEIKQFWVQVFAWISPMNACALTPPS